MYMYRQKVLTMYQLRGRLIFLLIVIVIIFVFIVYLGLPNERKKSEDLEFEFQPPSVSRSKLLRVTTRPKTQNNTDELYAVVFDAGSTGSRIHIFRFQVLSDGRLSLVNEIFEEVKPGLSAYADDPKKAAESLVSMINRALVEVPSHLQKTTPLTLKATAGLRLLPHGTADNILNEVTELLRGYPFHLPHNGITIMDGVDEGIFSWMTVNFMLGTLSDGTDTVAAIDMGGGSTQITLIPTLKETIEKSQADYIKNVSLFNKNYRMYTHSYLHLGLLSARVTLLGGDNIKGSESVELSSPCIPPGYSGHWSFGGQEYKIHGGTMHEFGYENCQHQTKSLVQNFIKPVEELGSRTIYIFSYFFDRALEAKLIGSDGGDITVGQLKEAAKSAFTNPDLERPFHSIDLTYLYSVLHYGYRLPRDKLIHLKKKINGVEISWGLGAAFELLSSVGLAR
ncbi:hypothetical protein CHS0354_041010 [Potamilus streckersoni]|uniref:Ectonucleoside triphosphate diphosphohydrolase 5 n=1 Tax=Potamilus streckersoni TaxID=2493646 RepID=A0AAE0SX00_9BIVA|nr:hypothetical protein CHS0354_041010 [Potamilus streckersoni]